MRVDYKGERPGSYDPERLKRSPEKRTVTEKVGDKVKIIFANNTKEGEIVSIVNSKTVTIKVNGTAYQAFTTQKEGVFASIT